MNAVLVIVGGYACLALGFVLGVVLASWLPQPGEPDDRRGQPQ